MKREYRRNPILNALIDPVKRKKLKAISLQLRLAGKTKDWVNVKPNGEPSDMTYLEMVRYGVNGVDFKIMQELLEVTE